MPSHVELSLFTLVLSLSLKESFLLFFVVNHFLVPFLLVQLEPKSCLLNLKLLTYCKCPDANLLCMLIITIVMYSSCVSNFTLFSGS